MTDEDAVHADPDEHSNEYDICESKMESNVFLSWLSKHISAHHIIWKDAIFSNAMNGEEVGSHGKVL